jgi:exopolysaccharide biosynthesis WecB/TagA/CpsF family protein
VNAGVASSPSGHVHVIDDLDLTKFISLAGGFGDAHFGYAVTPNADHMLRYRDDAAFRELYRSAAFVLMDSRFVASLMFIMKRRKLPVCTGADVTATLLRQVVRPMDRIVLIGGTPEQANRIAARYQLLNLRHYEPPMGFIKDRQAVEDCLRFVEQQSPFRFCFLAVGSPQQEVLGQLLHRRDIARGLALCVGASLNFLTGVERRAPSWMQRLALEWLYRLLQDPRRLAHRYLVRGPRIFGHLLRAQVVLRPAVSVQQPSLELSLSPAEPI